VVGFHWLKGRSTREERKPVTRDVDDDDDDDNNNKENSEVASFVSRHITIRLCCDISQACSDDIR
jgi:hypothetical protein